MSGQTRRRLAGWSALLLLMSVVPLLALPASANGNPPSVECSDPDWNGQYWKLQINDGAPGEVETNVPGAIAFEITEGSIIWTNQAANSVFQVIFKTGGGDFDKTEIGLWATGQGATFSLPQKLSHITYCYTAPGAEPGDADVFVSYGCAEDDLYRVSYSTVNATLSWLVDGLPASVASGDSFAAGVAVSWNATAEDGYVFGDDGDDISGGFTAVDCSDEPAPIDVAVLGACNVEQESFEVTVTGGAGAIVYVDLNGDGDYEDVGESNVADGTYTVTASPGDTVSWEAYAAASGFTNTASASATTEASMTATWPVTPTAGELLVAAFFSRGNVHSVSTAGWIQALEHTDAGNDDTMEIWYRVADGTEVGVTVELEAFEGSGDLLWIGEYPGMTNPSLDEMATGGPVSGVNSIASGTASATAVHEVAIAAFSQRAVNLTHDTYSGGFVELFEGTAAQDAARSTFSVASKGLASPAAAETTLTMSAVAGTAMGAIVTFGGDPIASGSIPVVECTTPTTPPTTPTTPPTTPVSTPTTAAAEVLGTTLSAPTTALAVSPATLPFTGSETGSALALGMALAGLGGLVLAAVSREEEEEARARR